MGCPQTLDSALPLAAGFPEMITDTIEIPSPINPLGIRGVVEFPTVTAAAPVAKSGRSIESCSALTPLQRKRPGSAPSPVGTPTR
jgi:hypothetical protein